VRIIFLGPPGAGKGTQARELAREWSVPQIATGDMLRDQMAAGTPLGREAKQFYDRGELVPDDVILRMIRERLTEPDAGRGFIFDGFPRNLAQAEALDEMLDAIGRQLDAILFFDLPDEVAYERMEGRARDEGRADDTPEAMRTRLAIYHEQTEPVAEHYRATGKLVPLHAARSVEQVFVEIENALDTVSAR
jgi:adenylate kinase